MEYRYEPSEGDTERLQKIKERVSGGLNLEREFPKSTEKARGKVVDTIANTSIRTGRLLDIQDIEIEYGIKEAESSAELKPMAHLQVLMGDGKLKYRINFSRRPMSVYLETMNKPLISAPSEELLVSDLAHELYHVRQGKFFPESLNKSAESSALGGERYLSDRGEYAARLFSLLYVANRDIPLWKLHKQQFRLINAAIKFGEILQIKGMKKSRVGQDKSQE